MFGYNPDEPENGAFAFAQWIVTDSRLLVKVPDSFSNIQAAAVRGIDDGGYFSTTISVPNARALEGFAL